MNRAEKLNTNYSFAFRLARDTRNWGSRVNRLFTLLLAISKITLHPTMSNRPIKRNITVESRFTAKKVRRRGYTRSFSSIIRTFARKYVQIYKLLGSYKYLSCVCKSHAIPSSISSGWNYCKITRDIEFCELFLVTYSTILLIICTQITHARDNYSIRRVFRQEMYLKYIAQSETIFASKKKKIYSCVGKWRKLCTRKYHKYHRERDLDFNGTLTVNAIVRRE